MNINKSGVNIGFIYGTQMSGYLRTISGKKQNWCVIFVLPNVDFIRETTMKSQTTFIEALVINDSKAKIILTKQ